MEIFLFKYGFYLSIVYQCDSKRPSGYILKFKDMYAEKSSLG